MIVPVLIILNTKDSQLTSYIQMLITARLRLRLTERWLKGINSFVWRRHTCCTWRLHFIFTWKKEIERWAEILSSFLLCKSVCACVALCTHQYVFLLLSVKTKDESWLTRSANDPELGLYLDFYLILSYFQVNLWTSLFQTMLLELTCMHTYCTIPRSNFPHFFTNHFLYWWGAPSRKQDHIYTCSSDQYVQYHNSFAGILSHVSQWDLPKQYWPVKKLQRH